MKLKLTLSPITTAAQRLASRVNTGGSDANVDLPTARMNVARSPVPVELMTARASKPLRIPTAVITSHPILHGEKSYLRALRAAEEAAWNTNIKTDLAGVLLPALTALCVLF